MKNSTLFKKAVEKGLKVGYLDIETSPYLNFSYPLYKANIAFENIITTMKVTSAVLMDEKTLHKTIVEWEFSPLVIDYKQVKGGGCDKAALKKLSEEIKKFDIIIMQNGDKYDAPVLQWRLYENRLPPITNLITIDTLKLSKRSFRPPNHKLDTRSQVAGCGGKIKQDIKDCIQVALGNPKASSLRVKYNIKDVTDLRKVYYRELDYYKFHEKTLNLLRSYIKEERIFCITCASKRQKKFEVKRVKLKGTIGGKWECQNCLTRWKIKKGEWEAHLDWLRLNNKRD